MEIGTLSPEYVAGSCNIGEAERALRTKVGIAGLILSLSIATVLIVFKVGWPVRLLIFLPAMIAATGLIQAGFKFCVKLALGGVNNFSDTLGNTQNVNDLVSQQKDIAKVRLIVRLSLICALIFTGLVLAIN